MKNIGVFYLKKFGFLEVKFSIYLNRRVFVMYIPDDFSTFTVTIQNICNIVANIYCRIDWIIHFD